MRSMGLRWEASACHMPPCRTSGGGLGPAAQTAPPLARWGRSRFHRGPSFWRLLATTFCPDVGRGEGLLATLDVLMVTCGTWNLCVVLFLSQAVPLYE